MEGFTISCNKCGHLLKIEDDTRARNADILISTDIRQYGTLNEYIEITLWCEKCMNHVELDN